MFYCHLRNLFKGFDRNIELILVGDFNINCVNEFSCGSVVEHCDSSAKGCGFNSRGTHILTINV